MRHPTQLIPKLLQNAAPTPGDRTRLRLLWERSPDRDNRRRTSKTPQKAIEATKDKHSRLRTAHLCIAVATNQLFPRSHGPPWECIPILPRQPTYGFPRRTVGTRNNVRLTLATAMRHNMQLECMGNRYDTIRLTVNESFQPFQSADNLLILDGTDSKKSNPFKTFTLIPYRFGKNRFL